MSMDTAIRASRSRSSAVRVGAGVRKSAAAVTVIKLLGRACRRCFKAGAWARSGRARYYQPREILAFEPLA
jgi:hypothetical protein